MNYKMVIHTIAQVVLVGAGLLALPLLVKKTSVPKRMVL